LIEFDSNQREALSFYYKQFPIWEKYDETVIQRKQRADELRKLLPEDKIDQLTIPEIDKVYRLLWSAGSRWEKELTKNNKDISKIKKTFKYLLYGKGDVFLRFEKVSKDPNYKLKTFSDSRISELFIKINPESGISLVNERIIRLSNRLGLKIIFDETSLAEKAKAYDEIAKTIQKQFDLKNLDETDMFIWFIDEYYRTGKQEPLPRFEKGQFLFVEEDFNSATEKKEDSTFLHDRFKILRTALENKLSPGFLKTIYLNNHWSQAGHYLSYHWLGFVPKKVKNPRTEIQFQVDIHSDYFESTIWLDQLAKDKIKIVIEKIEQNKGKFLELVGKLPSDYELGCHGSSRTWEGEDFEAGKFDQNQLDKLLELMKKRGAEFYTGLSFDKEGTIGQGLQITDTISQTFDNLVPFYEFFSGTKIDEGDYFILISYPDSKYADVEGQEYQYDSLKPNHKKLDDRSQVIIQGKSDNQVVFLGHCIVQSIKKSKTWKDKKKKEKPITKFVAKLENYDKFDPPKVRTEEIYNQMKNIKEFGSQQPSILPISKDLFKLIIGETAVIFERQLIETELLEKYSNLLKRKSQIIFYGPPGTGKTLTANELAEYLIKNQVKKPKEETSENNGRFFVALGPWSNWEHTKNNLPFRWGVSASTPSNVGVYNQMIAGDYVFFYCNQDPPRPFSQRGLFGVGTVKRKYYTDTEIYWPDEKEKGKVVYNHRFEIEPLKIVESDSELLPWVDGLPFTKGLNRISPGKPLEQLLNNLQNKWNITPPKLSGNNNPDCEFRTLVTFQSSEISCSSVYGSEAE